MNEEQSSTSQQVTPEVALPASGPSVGFFAVGLVINLVLIAAYFIWARKQWKKTSNRDE